MLPFRRPNPGHQGRFPWFRRPVSALTISCRSRLPAAFGRSVIPTENGTRLAFRKRTDMPSGRRASGHPPESNTFKPLNQSIDHRFSSRNSKESWNMTSGGRPRLCRIACIASFLSCAPALPVWAQVESPWVDPPATLSPVEPVPPSPPASVAPAPATPAPVEAAPPAPRAGQASPPADVAVPAPTPPVTPPASAGVTETSARRRTAEESRGSRDRSARPAAHAAGGHARPQGGTRHLRFPRLLVRT